MKSFFLILALFIAILDWIAIAKNWTKVGYIAKPGVMVALLAWLWQTGGFAGQLLWFGVGILFSMAGDIFLMLPREQFIAGLVAFLLAHVAYLVGFNATLPPATFASLLPPLLVGLAGGQIYKRIAAGLERSGKIKLRIPVFIYSVVISLMVVSALLTLVRTNEEWMPGPALIVSAGALLFFFSDTALAWNKFVTPLRYGRLPQMITYHVGQGLIVLGAALNFLR